MPAWSADGRWVYFNSDRSGQTQVWRVPIDGGEPVAISPPNARGPAASPDGRWIYYSRGSTDVSDIFRCPAEGGGGPETLVADFK